MRKPNSSTAPGGNYFQEPSLTFLITINAGIEMNCECFSSCSVLLYMSLFNMVSTCCETTPPNREGSALLNANTSPPWRMVSGLDGASVYYQYEASMQRCFNHRLYSCYNNLLCFIINYALIDNFTAQSLWVHIFIQFIVQFSYNYTHCLRQSVV